MWSVFPYQEKECSSNRFPKRLAIYREPMKRKYRYNFNALTGTKEVIQNFSLYFPLHFILVVANVHIIQVSNPLDSSLVPYIQHLPHESLPWKLLCHSRSYYSLLYLFQCHSAPFHQLGKTSRTFIFRVSCQFCLVNKPAGTSGAINAVQFSPPLFRDGVYHYPGGWTEKDAFLE